MSSALIVTQIKIMLFDFNSKLLCVVELIEFLLF